MSGIENILITLWITLEQTAIHAWWVYLLLAYCIFVGIKSSKDNVTPYIKVLVVPVLFLYLSLHSLLVSFAISTFIVTVYGVSVLLGAGVGYWQTVMRKIQIDRKKLLISQKGSWGTLVLIMTIFISKFYFGYTSSADPQYLHNTMYEVSFLAVSGVTSGMFLGRAIYYTYRMFFGPSVELSEK
jgi:hypothetical protein